MASVHKRGRSQFWQASWRSPDGVLHIKSTKLTDRAKALMLALEFERADRLAGAGELTESVARGILDGILERAGTGETLRNPTFREFSSTWLKHKEAARSGATAERYAQLVREFSNHLGARADRPLKAVTPRDVEGFFRKRTEAGLSRGTCVNDIKIVRALFGAARRQGLVTTNPGEAVELPAIRSTSKEVFEPAEIDMILNSCPTDEWKLVVMLGAFAGFRLGDAVGLTWPNVDMAAEVIRYRQQKTGREVTIPMHARLAEQLLRMAGAEGATSGPIAPVLAAMGVGGRSGLSRAFIQILRKAGVDERRSQGPGVRKLALRSFHSLRHTFVSGLANAGVSAELRMELAGHGSAAVHRRYSHIELETLRGAVGKIGGKNDSK